MNSRICKYALGRRLIGSIAWACLGAGVVPAALAGPSVREPEQPITLMFNDDESTALATEGYRLRGEIRKLLTSLNQALEADQLKKIKLIDIGRAHIMTMQLDRVGQQLISRGELLGTGFRLEAEVLNVRVNVLITALRQPFDLQLERGLEVLTARAEQRRSIADQMTKLRGQKKPTKAAGKFLSTFEELESMACWYLPERRERVMRPFDAVYGDLMNELSEQWKEEARPKFKAIVDTPLPDLTSFQTKLTPAVAAIGKDGTAAWNDKQLTGPELIGALFAERRKLDIALAHAAAVNWALPDNLGKANGARVLEEGNRFATTDFPAALASVVDADSERVTDADARDLYVSYVKALAAWQNPSDNAPPPSALTMALEKLAAKAPGLSGEVVAYRNATTDFLRWRGRAAEASASKARKTSGAIQLERDGLESFSGMSNAATLHSRTMDEIRKKRLKAQVAISCLWTTGGNEARTGDYVYKCPAPDAPWRAEVAQLKTDLQSDLAPPLTLEAAYAIAGAERGDWQEVGGEVVNVELDGMYTRQANCREADWNSVDMNRVAGRLTFNPVANGYLRSELKPSWLRGAHCFVQLP